MKRLLFTVMVLLVIAPIARGQADLFSDVTEGHEFFRSIEYVKDRNVVEGYEDGSYRPFSAINRAEFLKILMETKYANELANYSGSACFTDIAGDEWFARYVCYGKDIGIISGYPDGSFRPGQTISVIESLKILLETMMEEQWAVKYDQVAIEAAVYDDPFHIVLENFPETLEDVIGQWYDKYLTPAEFYGLILPNWSSFEQKVTRGEMAEMVFRIDYLMTEEETLVRESDWNIVRDFILSNYPISESYFDEHFRYVDSTIHTKIMDFENFIGGRYHIGVADVTMVQYEFIVVDTDGEEQILENSMWLHDDRVLENGDRVVDYYVRDGYVFDRFRRPIVESEVESIITIGEALDIAKGEEACIYDAQEDPQMPFTEAINLFSDGGRLLWIWSNGYEDGARLFGVSCSINAETGEIENVY